MSRHETTIREDDEGGRYVRDCTCEDASPAEHDTYKEAFSAGYGHWQDEVKGR